MTNKEGSKSKLDNSNSWNNCNALCKQMHNVAWGVEPLAFDALKTNLGAGLKALNAGESPRTFGVELQRPPVERIQCSSSFDSQTITNPNTGSKRSRKSRYGFNENLPPRSRTKKKPGEEYVPDRTIDSAIDKALHQTEPFSKLWARRSFQGIFWMHSEVSFAIEMSEIYQLLGEQQHEVARVWSTTYSLSVILFIL